MGKLTSKETIDGILWDSQKMDIGKLYAKYGVSKATLRNILKRNDVIAVKCDRSRDLIPKEKLAEVMANGWLSVEELCKQFDTSYYLVMKSLRAYGVVRGRKPTVRHRLKESTRAFKVLGEIMRNPNISREEIAKQFLCTREFVGQVEAMARQEGIIK